jgi:hypothetical protein
MKTSTLESPQFITDAKGKQLGVVLDLKTYRRMVEAEEELGDIRAYDAARPKVAAELAAGRSATLADYRAQRSARKK